MSRILVVDDEKSMRDFLAILLKKEGYQVTTASGGRQAVEAIHREIYDLVITDIRMSDLDGMGVLKAVKEHTPQTAVMMITAYGSTESAVEAMRLGACDYITKPFQVNDIQVRVRKALAERRLQEENALLRRELESRVGFRGFIGQCPAMQKVFALIRKVADTRSTVLITGESGTGKELVARAIHMQSHRHDAPFVTVNCGALTETLLESELFGHMKGAFTGAVANKPGLFEVAHGGTLFLDEISETSLSLQVKLLRVIQEKSFKRVGGTADITVDVRIIAATNQDLRQAVESGTFREDLYYRLNVIPIHLPPLRERREDIPLLVEHFLERFNREHGKRIRRVSPEAMELLVQAPWRGNVRELENVLERAVALSDGEVLTVDLLPRELLVEPVRGRGYTMELPPEGVDLEETVANLEKSLIHQALKRTGGRKTEAAKLLGLTFRAFRHRVKKHGIGWETDKSCQSTGTM